MRFLLDFVAYVAMIAALSHFVLFHSTRGGEVGEDGAWDREITWAEGSFATIFIFVRFVGATGIIRTMASNVELSCRRTPYTGGGGVE